MGRPFLSTPYEISPVVTLDATLELLTSVGLSKWTPGPDAFDPDSDEFFADAVWEDILTGDALKEHQEVQSQLERARWIDQELDRQRRNSDNLHYVDRERSEFVQPLREESGEDFSAGWWEDTPMSTPDRVASSSELSTAQSRRTHEEYVDARPSDWELVDLIPRAHPHHFASPLPFSDATLAALHSQRGRSPQPPSPTIEVTLDRDGDEMPNPPATAVISPSSAISPLDTPTTTVPRHPRSWYAPLRTHVTPDSIIPDTRIFVNDEPFNSTPFFSFSSPTSPTEETFAAAEVVAAVPPTPLR